jgi:hypothetical protein
VYATLAAVLLASPIAAALPRIEHDGGPFLRHPTVVTVTFAGDDPAVVARLETFGTHFVQSATWRDTAGGYCDDAGTCVGMGRAGRAVRLPHRWPAAVRDADVEAVLLRARADGALRDLAAESIVIAYLPPGVALSDAFYPRYCGGGPRAYHRLLGRGPAAVPYAVVPRCGGERDATGVASHEILEAATNPDPDRPGFRVSPDRRYGAFTAAGPEPVDVCRLVTEDTHWATDGGFAMQRGWSNSAAAAGRHPCASSADDRPYIALVPSAPAVRLAEDGATAVLELTAAADRDVGPWPVAVVDLAGHHDGTRYVEAEIDRRAVRAGETARLTLRRVRRHPDGAVVVGLRSTLDGRTHLWPLAVSMR